MDPCVPHSCAPAPRAASAALDWRPALARLGGDVDGFVSLLQALPAALTDLAAQLATAVAVDDTDAAARHAHTLKGLGRTFGAEALAACSERLEWHLRGIHGAAVPAHPQELLALARHVGDTVEAASRLVGELQPPPGPASAGAPRRLHELQALLADANLDAVECFERLDPHLQRDAPEVHARLSAAIARLDFHAALQACAQLQAVPGQPA